MELVNIDVLNDEFTEAAIYVSESATYKNYDKIATWYQRKKIN